MNNIDQIIDDIVDNEVALRKICKFAKTEEFNRLNDQEKVLIDKQAKVMDELSNVLKARVKLLIKGDEQAE